MASQRRGSALEDLLEIASRLPWVVSVTLAAVSFWVLTTVAQHFQAATSTQAADLAEPLVDSMYGTVAGFARWVVPSVLLIGAGASWWNRRRRVRLLDHATTDPTELERLSWRDFERLIGEAYRQQGYVVQELGGEGPDGGMDLVLRREGREALVQCKQWRQRQVGVTVVRELRGVMAQRRAAEGIVIGLGGFTREAEAFAREAGIRLLGREDAQALVKGLPIPVPEAGLTALETQRCPRCGSPMVRRTARQGQHAGREFFGCSRYPHCRGIVSGG